MEITVTLKETAVPGMKSSRNGGASATVIVEEGKLILGTWQDIYFCE